MFELYRGFASPDRNNDFIKEEQIKGFYFELGKQHV